MDTNYIAEELLHIVNGGAWHGPSLRELLGGISSGQAFIHPIPGRHSIWEIVNHIIVWHNAVKLRIDGVVTDPVGEEDWPPVSDTGENAWQDTCERLYNSGNLVAEAIQSVSSKKMLETVPGKPYPYHAMIVGLPAHDACHAGQISLLRKIIEESGD